MIRTRMRIGRIVGFALILVVLVGVFVVRLVDIQVVRAAELNDESRDIRSDTRPIYGTRGDIVDSDGAPLAESVMRWDIALSPKKAGPVERETPDPADPTKTVKTTVALPDVLAELGQALDLPAAQIQQVIDDALAADPDSDFAYVAKLVDNDARQRIVDLDIPWVVPWTHPSRIYPNGAVAGNLIGFSDSDGEPLAGLELAGDSCLAGVDGEERYLYSPYDWVEIPGTAQTLDEARDGGVLHTTIDSDLQWFAQRTALAQVQATGAKWATVTVMEAKTGRLLAVVDVPTVDPNDPAGADAADRGSRAFTAPYEPGSTFKALTAAALLDAGKATPTEGGVVAPYRWMPDDGANIADSEWHGDENLTLTGVLIESSNTGMSQFGMRLGDEERVGYMEKFGLGRASEVGFPGEEPGDLHGDPAAWDAQTKYATMFGQGLTTTAIQMASVYQTIANDGVRMPVTLVDGCEQPDGTTTDRPSGEGSRVISPQAAEETTQMLEQVYLHGWLAEDWNIPGYRVAAKTGTAQVPDGQGGYQDGYLVSVAGFAPADDPQFVVSVSLMDPVKMNSSAASAPVFQQVMSQVLKKYRTVPSGAPAPELPGTW